MRIIVTVIVLTVGVMGFLVGPSVQSGTVTGNGIAVGPGMRIETRCLGHEPVSTYNGDTGAYRLELPGRVCVTQAWSVRGEYTSGPQWFVASGDVLMDLDLWRRAR